MLLSGLAPDILLTILSLSEVKDLLRIEQTCRRLRDHVQTRHVWLAQLRRLDQAHAPNLPLHVDVRTLKRDELRTMVIKAIKGYENCRNGTLDELERTTVVIELNDPPMWENPPVDEEDLRAYIFYDEKKYTTVKLLPGGKHIFVEWSHGFVQLIDIVTHYAVWTYPEPPQAGEWTKRRMYVRAYDVDFRSDGYLLFSAASVYTDNAREIIVEAVQFDFEHLGMKRLYSRQIKIPSDSWTPYSMVVQGDFLALLLDGEEEKDGLYVLMDFMTNQLLFIEVPPDYSRPKVTIILEHLFLPCPTHRDSNKYQLKIVDIRNLFATLQKDCRSSSIETPLKLEDLWFTDIEFKLPLDHYADFLMNYVGIPSLCSFHWREKNDKFDQLTIEMPAEMDGDDDYDRRVVGLIFNSYAFTPRKSDKEPPTLSFISSTKVFPSQLSEYENQSLTRAENGTSCSISGRAIVQYADLREVGRVVEERVLIALDSETVDDNFKRGRKQMSQPFWVIPGSYNNKFHEPVLDHLSSAYIYVDWKGTRIKIVYPA